MKKQSEFEIWFKAQFGRLPVGEAEYQRLREVAENEKAKADIAKYAVTREENLSYAYKAALYAWNAKGGKE